MRRQSSPWVLIIGAAVMAIMFLVATNGGIATRTAQLSIKNKVQMVQMQNEVVR